MANSKYEYVRGFEQAVTLLPNTYLVIRVDGRCFHKGVTLSTKYGFKKPNDCCALDLMNAAAVAVMKELPEITLAYGLSDEYSFVFDSSCTLFDRRESKIVTTVVSTFTSYYVYLWTTYFPEKPLSPPMPSFDGRAVLYPSMQNLRDYLSWRQVDCHVNNLYNTTFWAMVQTGNMDATRAEEELKGTGASNKHEILFSEYKINYNKELDVFKKGSVVYRDYDLKDHLSTTKGSLNVPRVSGKAKSKITMEHVDLIKDEFWEARPWLFAKIQEKRRIESQ